MRYPSYGWIGVLIMITGSALIVLTEWWPIHTYFTPWMWSGYLLSADALLAMLRRRSWLVPDKRRFFLLLPISLLLWLIFEAYNLHLRNWTYIGLPESRFLQITGYAWSFATILPALFITADLLEAIGLRIRGTPLRTTPAIMKICFVSGLLMASIPLLLPAYMATYTFLSVWLAFLFLLEPIVRRRTHVPSLVRDLEEGKWTRWVSLGAGGLICGLIWEMWNALAGAKWVYIFPMFQNCKLFEMPLPGFLGFIPFAWEASAMYAVVLLLISRYWGRLYAPVSSDD